MSENVKEYQRGDLRDIHPFETLSRDFFNMKNWYYPKEDVKLTDNSSKIQIQSINEKAKYLNLFENNTNFSMINKEEKKIKLGNENTIKISGAKSETLDVIIYLLEYDSDFNQVNKRRIHLNRLTSFIVSPKTVYCRIAIRLSGQGELEVFNVFTSESIPKAMKAQKIGDNKPLDQIKVAAILNEEQLQDMTDVVTIITIDNWDESSSTAIPDLLLVDSSLRNSSIDSGKTRVDTTYQTLKQMILWCKKNHIPTVFWDVHGSINVEIIREIFPFFNFVFTVDGDLIKAYQQLVKHDNIYQLSHAVNPKIHNPMNINKDMINQFFNEHLAIPRRKLPIGSIDKRVANLSNLGVEVIYTGRNLEESGQVDLTNCTLLINKENKSKAQSIIPKSVIEVLASGIPVINRNSSIINRAFPGIVQSAWNDNEIIESINKLSTQPRVYRELSSKSTREIFRNHTYQKRMQYLLDCVSIPFELPPQDITLIFTAYSKEVFYKTMETIKNQSYQQVRIIALISVFDGYEEIYNQFNHNNVYVYLEEYVYEKYRISDLIKTKYVSVLNPESHYNEFYIEDYIYAFHYSNAVCVGQSKSINSDNHDRFHEKEFEYVDAIESYSGFFEVSAIQEGSFYDLVNDQTKIIEKFIIQKDKRIFCIGRLL